MRNLILIWTATITLYGFTYGQSSSETNALIEVQYTSDSIYTEVDDRAFPIFKQCIKKKSSPQEVKSCSKSTMLEIVFKELEIPAEAKKKGVNFATSVVQFIVYKNGEVGPTSLLVDPGYGLGEVAVRAVSKMIENAESWYPAVKNEEAVSSMQKFPVRFNINN
jgi:hypothetical protein